MPSIVTVNVTQQVAPTPSTLQQTGAFVSQGGTSTSANTLTLLTQMSDLTAILNTAKANSSLTWATNVVTVTTAAPHGFTTSDTLQITIAGAVPTGFNGSFSATITGADTFTYPLASDPGSETTPGTYILEDVAELTAMGTTFFAQGSQVPVYVLELGAGSAADGVTALTTWIGNNPGTIYSYLVPRYWDAAPTFLTMLASYEATTAKTYFWVTTTTENYTNYTNLMKCVNALVEAPSIGATEFSQAAAFWKSLSYQPSSTNKVAPFAFSFLFGVTPYPTKGNATLLQQLKTADISYIGTGAEGGISNTIELWGTMLDGNPFNYWYSVDWMQIQSDQALANAIINGSNTPLNPLYLDQDGINRLQEVLKQVCTSAVTFGLAIGNVTLTQMDGTTFANALATNQFTNQVVINAVPFVSYYTASPGDYKIGKYSGFSIVYIPARGFDQIVLNIVVSQFVTA